jgi:hypothetical protein
MVRSAGLLSRPRWCWILAILGDTSSITDDDDAAQVHARRMATRRSLGAEQDDMEHLLSG